MSGNASRVLDFIQRAKKLNEHSKSVTEVPIRLPTPNKSFDNKISAGGQRPGNENVKRLSRPPTPKISVNSRSETPKSRSSPSYPYSKSPKNSEILTKLPVDTKNLEETIENLLKIRADIEEKIKEQQMKELQIIQTLSKKLQKVKFVQETFKTIEKAEKAYKEKYEIIVGKSKEKLREIELELKEIEDENKSLKGNSVKKVRAWKGEEAGFEVKVKNESELEMVVDEQIVYLLKEIGNNENERIEKELCVALGKKLLLEQQRITKAENSAINILRQEEGLINLLEERVKNIEGNV